MACMNCSEPRLVFVASAGRAVFPTAISAVAFTCPCKMPLRSLYAQLLYAPQLGSAKKTTGCSWLSPKDSKVKPWHVNTARPLWVAKVKMGMHALRGRQWQNCHSSSYSRGRYLRPFHQSGAGVWAHHCLMTPYTRPVCFLCAARPLVVMWYFWCYMITRPHVQVLGRLSSPTFFKGTSTRDV